VLWPRPDLEVVIALSLYVVDLVAGGRADGPCRSWLPLCAGASRDGQGRLRRGARRLALALPEAAARGAQDLTGVSQVTRL
jgi:hypothetical protein